MKLIWFVADSREYLNTLL